MLARLGVIGTSSPSSSQAPPTLEEIESDLRHAPVDDVAFLTRVPDISATTSAAAAVGEGGQSGAVVAPSEPEPFHLGERFRQFKQEDGQVQDDLVEDHDALVDKLIASRLNQEKVKTLRQRLSEGLDELDKSKVDLARDVSELSALHQEAKEKQDKVKLAKAVTNKRNR